MEVVPGKWDGMVVVVPQKEVQENHQDHDQSLLLQS